MREILFRSKTIENEQWVEGYFVHVPCGRFLSEEYLIQTIKEDGRIDQLYTVYESTVGQFTGLIDKNGKKIFEGDIVEGHCYSRWRHDMQRCEVAYGRDGFECRHHIGGIDTDYYTYRVLFSKDVAVIGNIYDNPELLEGE